MRPGRLAPLGGLKRGQKGRIESIQRSDSFACRLLEMGFIEGSEIEIAYDAPFGGGLFAVRVRGSLIALRREDAGGIEVRLDE